MQLEDGNLCRSLRWLYLSLILRSVSAAVTDSTCSCHDYGSCEFRDFHPSHPSKQNVAVGKTAKMSSRFNSTKHNETSGPACLAVNGKTNTTFRPVSQFPDSPNCIHTGDDDREPYWEVDLGQRYSINSITIYWRDFYYSGSRRSEGVNITVDGQLCHTIRPPGSNPSNIICSEQLSGQSVRLSKNDNETVGAYYINVCEVQVWVCRPGFFGSQCHHVCPKPVCEDNNFCSPIDGTCPNAVATTSPASWDITKLVFPLTGSVLAGFVVIGIIIAAVWWVRRSRDRRVELTTGTQSADSVAVRVGDNPTMAQVSDVGKSEVRDDDIRCGPAQAAPRSGDAYRLRYTGLRHTGLRHTGLRHTGLRYTGLRHTGLRYTGLRHTGLRYTGLRHTGLRENQTEDYVNLSDISGVPVQGRKRNKNNPFPTRMSDKCAMNSELSDDEEYQEIE